MKKYIQSATITPDEAIKMYEADEPVFAISGSNYYYEGDEEFYAGKISDLKKKIASQIEPDDTKDYILDIVDAAIESAAELTITAESAFRDAVEAAKTKYK